MATGGARAEGRMCQDATKGRLPGRKAGWPKASRLPIFMQTHPARQIAEASNFGPHGRNLVHHQEQAASEKKIIGHQIKLRVTIYSVDPKTLYLVHPQGVCNITVQMA